MTNPDAALVREAARRLNVVQHVRTPEGDLERIVIPLVTELLSLADRMEGAGQPDVGLDYCRICLPVPGSLVGETGHEECLRIEMEREESTQLTAKPDVAGWLRERADGK